MKLQSFLENLYFGKIDNSLLKYYETPDDDPVTAGIISAYHEVTADYPPGKLESLGVVPDELLEKLKPIGFFGLFIPKEYGGVGLSLFRYLKIVRDLVKYDMALGILSLAHLSIGIKAVILFGNESQKKKYLPLAASGEMIFCYALTEPLTGSDAKNIDTTAELSPDGKYYILNGSKTFITNASYAGGLTVFAQMDRNKKGSLGAFIVETGWEGVTVGKNMDKMGLKASSTGSFQFKNVRIPRENLIGNPGDGFKIAMTILNYGRLALGAASSGMLKASFDEMIARANGRIQFGKPIIEYELIQEKIVRAYAEYEAVWAMTNFTAGLLEKNPVEYVAVESSHCKLYGTNRAWESLYDAMQVAGGSGYLKTNPYEKRMRDFRVTTIFEGTTEIHYIYPPVSMLKNLARQIYAKSIFMRIPLFASLYLKSSALKIGGGDRIIKKSLRFIRGYAGLFRRNFIFTMVKYGKKMPDRELVLRRMTDLSCRIFAVVSLTEKYRNMKTSGQNAGHISKALSYYIYDAENKIKGDFKVKPEKTGMIYVKLIKCLKDRIGESDDGKT